MNRIMNWQTWSENVIAHGYLTASKHPTQHMNDVTHIKKTRGNYMYGVNNEKIFDTVSGLGANIKHIHNVATLPYKEEVILADMITKKFPVDKVRFVKTGSAACEAAIRIARGYTKRNIVLSSGYHGCHESFVAVTPPAVGCINDNQLYRFDTVKEIVEYIKQVKGVDKERHDIAAVIIEPIELENSCKRRDILRELQLECKQRNILVIFDEMITNCRVPYYCVANYYTLSPDLMCLGKAIANGYPLAVVGGKAEVMDTPQYFISNTHNGEVKSIKEAIKFLKWFNEDRLWKFYKKSEDLMEQINYAGLIYVKLKGYQTRAIWDGHPENVDKFHRLMSKHGYHTGKVFFPKISWSKRDIKKFVKTLKFVCHYELCKFELDKEPTKPIFERT